MAMAKLSLLFPLLLLLLSLSLSSPSLALGFPLSAYGFSVSSNSRCSCGSIDECSQDEVDDPTTRRFLAGNSGYISYVALRRDSVLCRPSAQENPYCRGCSTITRCRGEPRGVELILPDCCEDVEIVPLKKYFGGNEGPGTYTWYRIREKPAEQDLISLTSLSEALLISETLTYKSLLEDVGFYLALRWVPTRDDGAIGGALVSISTNPVMPGFFFNGVSYGLLI